MSKKMFTQHAYLASQSKSDKYLTLISVEEKTYKNYQALHWERHINFPYSWNHIC